MENIVTHCVCCIPDSRVPQKEGETVPLFFQPHSPHHLAKAAKFQLPSYNMDCENREALTKASRSGVVSSEDQNVDDNDKSYHYRQRLFLKLIK
jgi:hypothetical protein